MPKYNSIDTIPAKVFFEILHTKNYQLLKPKPREKGLEDIFIVIYDDFFIKSDNAEANAYLKITKEIAFLEHKIAYLKQALHFYLYNRTTEQMRSDFIDALNKGYDILIDKNITFIEEVQRILSIDLGGIQNDLTMAKMTYESMSKKSQQKAFDYEDNIVNMEQVIGRNINDGIMLDKYISYEKQAKRVVENNNKKK